MQDKPRTVFHVNTFFLVASEQLPRYQSVDSQQKGDKFPRQNEVSANGCRRPTA